MHPKFMSDKSAVLKAVNSEREHIEMAVDLNSMKFLQFVMKLLHFATDSAIKLVASVILYGRCSRINKLCH
jgi:hypothetical protein